MALPAATLLGVKTSARNKQCPSFLRALKKAPSFPLTKTFKLFLSSASAEKKRSVLYLFIS